MKSAKQETVPIASSSDVVLARQKVRQWAIEMKFTLVDQTKLVTAASELARNALEHGKGGQMVIEQVENSIKSGLNWCLKIAARESVTWMPLCATVTPPAEAWAWDWVGAKDSSTSFKLNQNLVKGRELP
jgi:hypothetical protein